MDKCPSYPRTFVHQRQREKEIEIEIERELERKKGHDARAYGRYKNVLLSDSDLVSLKEEFPNEWERYIEKLSEFMASTGRQYESHAATIRRWIRQDCAKAVRMPDYSCEEGESL